MNKRGAVVALLDSCAVPFAATAQRTGKVYRIGFLGPATASASAGRMEELRAGLRERGYVEGKNIVIEYRWADDKCERLPALAVELVRLDVDLIVTGGVPGTRAAKEASTSIPIVIAASGDVVASGLVASLQRPGGNATGSTYFIQELFAKRLELLKEAMPRITQVGILINPRNPANLTNIGKTQAAAAAMKIRLHLFEARGPGDFAAVFEEMVENGVEAVEVLEDPMLNANATEAARQAARQRLPSIGFNEFAVAGVMLGYGVDILELYRRVGYFVDRILMGTSPAEVPVEQATRFQLLVNLKTARLTGVTIPQSLLLRADTVIE